MKKTRILIPNRGMIALDIIYTYKSLGLETIILHSPEDNLSLPVRLADKSVKFLSSKLKDSYLDKEAIIEKALELEVDYIHPGYGFLSEDIELAKLCEERGIKLIAPSSDVLKVTQNKIETLKLAEQLDIPVINHSNAITVHLDIEHIKTMKFPLIIKPIMTANAYGVSKANNSTEANKIISNLLKREAFKKQGLIAEEFLPNTKQIEIPFLRDKQGNTIMFPEIEASIQRRFVRIFQESPSIALDECLREKLYKYSKKIIDSINYDGLGSVEFLVDINKGEVFLLEINSSYQINHQIAEIYSKKSLLEMQLLIVQGKEISKSNYEVLEPSGHIGLASLMAEDPYNNFMPSTGVIEDYYYYSTNSEKIKTLIYKGANIPAQYSPYIGKVISERNNREEVLNNLISFLDFIYIRGVNTNIDFLKVILQKLKEKKGQETINFIDEFSYMKEIRDDDLDVVAALAATEFHLENRKRNLREEVKNMKKPNIFVRIFSNFR